MPFCQGRHFDRVIRNIGRLDQVRFALFTEDLVNELSFTHGGIDLDMQLFGRFPEFFLIHFRDIDACEFFNGPVHGIPFPRTFEIDLVLPYLHFRCAVQVDRDFFDHFLHKIHHPFIILVGDVQLDLRKFRIMEATHAFVPEVFGKLVNPVKSTHNEPFQVQLIRDPEVQGHVQRIVESLERPGSGTTVQGLQHRRLHLEISLAIQEMPDGIIHFCPFQKHVPDVGIDDQVHIPLAVPQFRIGKGIVYLPFSIDLDNRKGLQ